MMVSTRHLIILALFTGLLSAPSVFRPQTPGENLPAEPLVNVLSLLIHRDDKLRRAAFRELDRRKDARAIPGLIEMLRLQKPEPDSQLEILLRKLTSKNLGPDWTKWHEWLAQQERVELPPQFLEWKAALYRMWIDPAFSSFLYPGMPLRIRIEEIVWGGVKKDGIPALTNPKLINASEADYLRAKDLVFGVELNGDARAYPHRLMDSHEMLNDVVGGQAVSLAYCTLCRSGILFDTTVDGRSFTFGSSGLLYRSNKLMYDHQTESLWMTIPGEPVSGKLAQSGIRLKRLPVVVTTWEDWKSSHPDTRVLSLETGYNRDYRPGALYGEYFASPDLMFPAPKRDDRLKPKDEVFALLLNGQPKAYPLRKLREKRIINDRLGNENIALITTAKSGAVRAYFRGERSFLPAVNSGETIKATDNSRWKLTEAALINEASGERLLRLPGHLAYWFGWVNFYPQTLLFSP
jgi:hypothetical protein